VLPSNKAIGGYFELELPQGFVEKYPGALGYQSARAAFMALLQNSPAITRVWMPYYICDSMVSPVLAAGKELAFYRIDQRFFIEDRLNLAEGDLLLYVNYFGVCDRNVLELLCTYDPKRVVIDCSQAFYSGPFNCLATIYSPRKFFGVPDGGLLMTAVSIPEPLQIDEGSCQRATHLIKRLSFDAEAGYGDYQAAELTLSDVAPKRISQLTSRLLRSIDYDAVRARRKRNFSALHHALGSTNRLSVDLDVINGPMAYPYLPAEGALRQQLISHRVFIATYWTEVLERVPQEGHEAKLVSNLCALPCDQRLSADAVARIINLVERN